jgi:excisionase family DNA binding protein
VEEATRLLSISEFAQRVGVSANTVRNWGKRGLISPIRLPSGQRRFTEEMVKEILEKERV